MTDIDLGDSYSSIFLEENWAHQEFYGWQVLLNTDFCRVLKKRQGPLTRSLVLLRTNRGDDGRLVIQEQAKRGLFSETVVHDFSDTTSDCEWYRSHGFHPADVSERMLNTATFIIDLENSDESLLQAMSADYRRKIRKATENGVSVRILPNPDFNLVIDFTKELRTFSKSKGFRATDLKVLQAMYDNGRAVLCILEGPNGILGYLHLYLAGPTGIFMYGILLEKHNNGSGQFLHWRIMLWLKENGYRWYDLGGIPSLNPEDGIFRFKAGFGGAVRQLGTEWVKRGVAYEAVLKIKHALAKIGLVE